MYNIMVVLIIFSVILKTVINLIMLSIKGFYSVVFMALADADCKFIWTDIGGKGSAFTVLLG